MKIDELKPITISIGWEQIFQGPSYWGLKEWYKFIDFIADLGYNLLYLLSWKSDLVIPFNWYEIKQYRYINEYSLLSPLNLQQWDGKKMVQGKWWHPFLRDEDMLEKIISYAHRKKIKIGYFTTPRIPCIRKREPWLRYWETILGTLVERYDFDAFLIEDEETPELYYHLKSCALCRKEWGREIPLARVRAEGWKFEKLNDMLPTASRKPIILSTVPHCSLFKYGVPLRENGWVENTDLYAKCLTEYDALTPKHLLFSWVPPESCSPHFRKIFSARIIEGGYNGYWPALERFADAEIAIVANSPKFSRVKHGNPSAAQFLYGKRAGQDYLSFLKEAKIDGSTEIKLFEGLDHPRSIETMTQMIKQEDAGNRENFINRIEKLLRRGKLLEEKLNNICGKASSSTTWNGKLGLRKIQGLFRKSVLALEYLLHYNVFLRARKKEDKICALKKMENTAKAICDAMVVYQKEWPGTGSRLEFKCNSAYELNVPEGEGTVYRDYMEHARKLTEELKDSAYCGSC